MMTTEVPSGKIKFWTFLMALMLLVAVAVTLIDISIKTAILEESGNLRRVILGQREDQSGNVEGNNPDSNHNGNSAGYVLRTGNAGLEKGRSGRRRTQPPPSTEGEAGPISTSDPEIPTGD